MKPGTKVTLKGCPSIGGMPAVARETATILRWNSKVSGERIDGYHTARFDSDRAVLLVHEERFA